MKKNLLINDKIGVMTVKSINPFVVEIGGETYSAEIRGEKKESPFAISYNFFIDAHNEDGTVASVELPEDYAVYGVEQCFASLNTNLAGDASKLDSTRIYYPGPEKMKLDFTALKKNMEGYGDPLYFHGDGQSAEMVFTAPFGIVTETVHTFILK